MRPGVSSEWWNSAHTSINTWAEFCDAFTSRMTDPNRRTALWGEWEGVKQIGADHEGFHQRIIKLAEELGIPAMDRSRKYLFGLSASLHTQAQLFVNTRRAEAGHPEDWFPPLPSLHTYIKTVAPATKQPGTISALTERSSADSRMDRLESLLVAAIGGQAVRGAVRPTSQSLDIVTWPDVKSGKAKYLPKISDLSSIQKQFLESQKICMRCRCSTDHVTADCPHQNEMDTFFKARIAAREKKKADFSRGS